MTTSPSVSTLPGTCRTKKAWCPDPYPDPDPFHAWSISEPSHATTSANMKVRICYYFCCCFLRYLCFYFYFCLYFYFYFCCYYYYYFYYYCCCCYATITTTPLDYFTVITLTLTSTTVTATAISTATAAPPCIAATAAGVVFFYCSLY